MVNSTWRGHNIYFDEYVWRYIDTDEIVQNNPNIHCGHCKELPTEEGHDGCLGTLKGIKNTCCGHGVVKEAYVQFLDGFSIHGEDAVVIQNILKKYRD